MLIMFNTRLKVISLFILIGLIIYPTFSDKTLLPGARLDVYVSLVLSTDESPNDFYQNH